MKSEFPIEFQDMNVCYWCHKPFTLGFQHSSRVEPLSVGLSLHFIVIKHFKSWLFRRIRAVYPQAMKITHEYQNTHSLGTQSSVWIKSNLKCVCLHRKTFYLCVCVCVYELKVWMEDIPVFFLSQPLKHNEEKRRANTHGVPQHTGSPRFKHKTYNNDHGEKIMRTKV